MNSHLHSTNQLKEVEKLLKDFYCPNSSNERKREIEKQLEVFKNRTESWQICLISLPSITNQSLWFFCCSTIEMIIIKNWHMLSVESKQHLRETLWNMVLSFTPSTTNMEKQKICQLIAIIGKREFPNEDRSYMDRVLEVIQNKFQLGLTLLQETNTEITSTKADITSDMKRNFTSAVQLYLPTLMPILHRYLSLIAFRLCENCRADIQIIPNSMDNANFQPIFADETRLNAASIDFLLCIQSIFQWANLDEVLSKEFLKNIFSLSEWNDENCDVRITALATISDLFYRQAAIPLQTEIATGIIRLIQQPQLGNANEHYQDRLTELLRLFTDQQWKKWINTPEFPVNQYLTHLFQFTFSECSALSLTERLGIWKTIIQNAKKGCTAEVKEKILDLISTTIKRIQYHYDPDLDLLDNDHIDDNLETEYQQFQTQCINIIVMVAEIEPVTVYEMVLVDFNKFQGPMDVFNFIITALPLKVDPNNESIDKKKIAILNDSSKCHQIHCMLRDLSTLCQIIARISPIVQGNLVAIDESIKMITKNLMESIKVVGAKKLTVNEIYNLNSYNDFHTTIAQIMTALKFLIILTPQVHENNTEMNSFIDVLAQLLLPCSNGLNVSESVVSEPSIITLACAQLLFTITSQLRPHYIIENQNIQWLATINSNHLDFPVRLCIYKIMCNIFILPWNGMAGPQDQQWVRRQKLLEDYINLALAKDLVTFDMTTLQMPGAQTQLLLVIAEVLPLVTEILDHYQENTSHDKSMLANATKLVIARCLEIYRTVGSLNLEIAENVLTFFLSVIRTLQLQLGTQAIREYLALFLEMTTASLNSAPGGLTGLRSLETLLKMLLVVVEQPGAATMSLIPDMLEVTLGQVIPLINSHRNTHLVEYTDVALAAYLLFDGIVLHRWQYFYRSQIVRGFSPGASDDLHPGDEAPLHPEHLFGILTAYGNALVCGNDPQLARTVLLSLEKIEERCRLYQKEFFKQHLMPQFLTALINTITAPEGMILFDLLLNVLFKMGRTNVKLLHQALVEFGIPNGSQFISDICSATDLPTFTHFLTQLVQDVHCNRNSHS